MSSTGQGAVRVENDFYPTPNWCIDLISEKIQWDRVASMMEPGKGEGAILDSVPHGVATEWAEITEGRDYLTMDLPDVDLSWTNPPFNLAQEFLSRSLGQAKTVVFLLRINFLGSAKRRAFLQANRPTHLYVMSERPSFVDVCAGQNIKIFGAGEKLIEKKKQSGCGWAFQKKAEVKICPNCKCPVKAGTDSIEYAWMCWDRGGIMRDEPGVYFL